MPSGELHNCELCPYQRLGKCHKGDIVLVKRDNGEVVVGEVRWHIAVRIDDQTEVISNLNLWHLVSEGPRSCKWRRSPDLTCCMTDEIRCSLICAGGDVVTTLKPTYV